MMGAYCEYLWTGEDLREELVDIPSKPFTKYIDLSGGIVRLVI